MIPTTLWMVLFFTAALIFVFVLFFADRGERAVVQGVLMGSVVAVIVAMLLLLYSLDHPFHDGVGGLQPVAMERTLRDHRRAARRRRHRRRDALRRRREPACSADGLAGVAAGVGARRSGGWPCALLVAVARSVAGRGRSCPPPSGRDVQGVVAPLMPALGATFAVLMAITLSSEAGYLKSAQDLVSAEAAAGGPPGVGGDEPRGRQRRGSSRRCSTTCGPPRPRSGRAMTRPGATTRRRGRRSPRWSASCGPRPPGQRARHAGEHGAVGVARRRSRRHAGRASAAASRDLPTLYVVTLVASGVALIANAGALVVGVGRRPSLLVGGLAVVVGLSLALLFSITEPWRGPLVVLGPADRRRRRRPPGGVLHAP